MLRSGRDADSSIATVAAAIGEPARARILLHLMGGTARSSTELAVVAQVSPSTASVHLSRLKAANLVKVEVQGKLRLYSLTGPDLATALEGLSVLAGAQGQDFASATPTHLRAARTCYDHIAGTIGVSLHDRLRELGWISAAATHNGAVYELTVEGTSGLDALGIDVGAIRNLRRQFAYACLDWSERRPHIGGAMGAALLRAALERKWVIPELDSRALRITNLGRRELLQRFGLRV